MMRYLFCIILLLQACAKPVGTTKEQLQSYQEYIGNLEVALSYVSSGQYDLAKTKFHEALRYQSIKHNEYVEIEETIGKINSYQKAIIEKRDSKRLRLFSFPPRYPRGALQRGVESTVGLTFTISKLGKVSDIELTDYVCTSQGDSESYAREKDAFEKSAIKAVKKFRFLPKIVDGQSVEEKVSQEIDFRLAK